jgi:hypothetical protein
MPTGSFWSWMHGAVFGLFMGLFMSVYNMGRWPNISLRKLVLSTVLSSVLLFFAFGLWESFGSRAFRAPLVFLTMASGSCGLLTLWFARRAQ